MALFRRRAVEAPKRLILHVGMHKTATTSLQKMFFENRDTFAERGVYYPEASRTYLGHHLLAYEAFNPDNAEAAGALAGLVAELDAVDPEGVLISSENLEHLVFLPERLIEIRDALSGLGYEIFVLITLREVGEYAEAICAELHKHGFERTSGEVTAEIIERGCLTNNGLTFPFDLTMLVGTFDDLVGADHVDLLVYNDEIVPEMLEVISSRLGSTPGSPVEIIRTNLRIRGDGEAPGFEAADKDRIRAALGDQIGPLVAQHRH